MKSYNLNCSVNKFLADTATPVSIYLRLRDLYGSCFLLESTDYRPNEKCFSYICCQPIAEFYLKGNLIRQRFPDNHKENKILTKEDSVIENFRKFTERFHIKYEQEQPPIDNGFFGYTAYDNIANFETIDISAYGETEHCPIPDMVYQVFQYVIAIDHYSNNMFILQNSLENQPVEDINTFVYKLIHKDFPQYDFQKQGEQSSNFSSSQFEKCIQKCQEHIARGDVFQIVPSRRFAQKFTGDEFNVYRALRSINPSPYLFYFDYGNFKIFGSSPEAQLIVEEGKASLFPIAGTYRRTGNDEIDLQAVQNLLQDEKENAEHVMLVDLARNDLSRHCENVQVEKYQEVQMFSHVIHLTSKVTGQVLSNVTALDIFHRTFPMGTLSGAPKYRAMELLAQYEKGPRRAYGGAIGSFSFNGSCNHAIVIRSFISYENTLYFQAGAGIVASSIPQKEVQEVENKLRALQKALNLAERMSSGKNICVG